jgi:hypothetical protein
MDLIHVGTMARGQNKVSCWFLMNDDPTSYALVYQSPHKHDLAGACLFDLPNYHERICPETHDFPVAAFDSPYAESYHTIPASSFDGVPFSFNQPLPEQTAFVPDAAVLQLILEWIQRSHLLHCDVCFTHRGTQLH